MSLSATLSLKKDDGTSQDFVTVDQLPNLPGTKRSNTSVDLPDSSSLLIRSQPIGTKSQRAQRHTTTIDYIKVDTNGVAQKGSASLGLVFPDSTAFTAQMMIDLVHQLLDVFISTSTFDVDDAVVKSVLRGES